MWIGKPGKINDRIYFLGALLNCMYLLRGKDAMIVGGGMSWLVPTLEKQFAQLEIETEKLKYLVIQHSHFDHCGAVPYLKRKFPQIKILASAYSKEVFTREKVIDFIAASNQRMIDKLALQDESKRLNLEFDGITVDRVVKEADIIDLGDGIKAQLLEVPGHTKCSIAVYVPKLKAMFPTDAAPTPTDDGSALSYPSPQYDFQLYLKSLKKLAIHDVEMCAFEHNGVIIGSEAKNILTQGLEKTEKFRKHVIQKHQEIRDLDRLAEVVLAELTETEPLDFISNDLRLDITKAVLQKILTYPG